MLVGVTLLTCLSGAEYEDEPRPDTIGERWLGFAGMTGLAGTAGLEIDFAGALCWGDRVRMSRLGLEAGLLPGE